MLHDKSLPNIYCTILNIKLISSSGIRENCMKDKVYDKGVGNSDDFWNHNLLID